MTRPSLTDARARTPRRRLGLLALLAACGSIAEPPAAAPVAVVTITAPNPSPLLVTGTSVRLAAVAQDAAGAPLPDAELQWSSEDERILKVDRDGLVTGRAPGSATVHATAGGVDAHLGLTVRGAGQLFVNPDSSQMLPGQVRALVVDLDGAPTATVITGAWISSNPAVVTVDTAGVLRAGSAGTATVTLTIGTVTLQAVVTVPAVTIPLQFSLLASTGSNLGPNNCALDVTGSAWCWGYAGYGNTGLLGTTAALDHCVWYTHDVSHIGISSPEWRRSIYACAMEPVRVQSPAPFTSLTVGLNLSAMVSCGLTADGQAFCWGATDELPGGGSGPQMVPVSSTLRFARFNYPCGVTTTNEAWCYGDAAVRGSAAAPEPGRPSQVAGGATWAEVTGGGGTIAGQSYIHSRCGLTTVGVAMCWGDNTYGQLGTGDSVSSATPRAVRTAEHFTHIVPRQSGACALSTRQLVLCWGAFGPAVPAPAATQQFATLSGECALTPDGALWCRSPTSPYVLVDTGVPMRFRSYTGTAESGCGIALDGIAYCRGANYFGQAGVGDLVARAQPTRVVGQ